MAGLIAVLSACNGSEKDATSSENPFLQSILHLLEYLLLTKSK